MQFAKGGFRGSARRAPCRAPSGRSNGEELYAHIHSTVGPIGRVYIYCSKNRARHTYNTPETRASSGGDGGSKDTDPKTKNVRNQVYTRPEWHRINDGAAAEAGSVGIKGMRRVANPVIRCSEHWSTCRVHRLCVKAKIYIIVFLFKIISASASTSAIAHVNICILGWYCCMCMCIIYYIFIY